MLKCNKCHFESEETDAYCRKCGAGLAQEARFQEIANDETELATNSAQVEAKVIEIVNVAPETRPAPVAGRTLAFSRKLGSKVSEALKSEQGQKLARGATALAVAVGVELVTNAANRLSKAPAQPKASGGSLSRPPVGVGDALLKAMEDRLANTDPDVVEEVYMRERVYIRRVIRKRQG